MNCLLPAYAKNGTLKRKLDMPKTAIAAVARAEERIADKATAGKAKAQAEPMKVVTAAIEALEALKQVPSLRSALASLKALSAASFDTDSMDKQAAEQAAQREAPKASEVLKPTTNGAALPEGVTEDILSQLAGNMALMAQQLAALKTK